MTQEKMTITATVTERKVAETLEALSSLIREKNFNQKIILGAYFYFIVSETFIKDKKIPASFENEGKFFVLTEEEEEYFNKILSEALANPGEENLISH